LGLSRTIGVGLLLSRTIGGIRFSCHTAPVWGGCISFWPVLFTQNIHLNYIVFCS
jgi:hypothetical protein